MPKSVKDRIHQYVDRHPEGVTPGELAKRLRVSPRAVSDALRDLVTEGFVERPSPKGKVYPTGAAQPKARRSRSTDRGAGRPDWLSTEAIAGWGALLGVLIGLAFKLGVLRPRKIAEHQHEALGWLFKAGPAGRNLAERVIAGAGILGAAQHASEDPEERQRQLARAELAAAERELRRRVQWRDNLAVCVKASPGQRMISGLEALGVIRPAAVPAPVPGVPVMPLEPGRQLRASRRPMKTVGTGGEPPTQLWEPGPNFSFDYAPVREVATPGCILYRQQLPLVAGLHLRQAQEGVEAMVGPAAAYLRRRTRPASTGRCAPRPRAGA